VLPDDYNRSNRIVTVLQWCAVAFIRCFPFVGVSNSIQTPSVDRRIFLMRPMLGGLPDAALHTDVAPFADNRFDCCDLLQRNVIHPGTGKASGIRSVFMPRSTPDYSFEKANQCFRRSRTVFERAS